MWHILSRLIFVFQLIWMKCFGDLSLTNNNTSTENDKNTDKLISKLESCNEGNDYQLLVQAVKNCINKEIQHLTEKLLRNPKIVNVIYERQSMNKNVTNKMSPVQSEDIKNVLEKNVYSLDLKDWEKLYAETLKYIIPIRDVSTNDAVVH